MSETRRCGRCNRWVFLDVCGCESFEWWAPKWDGSTEEDSKIEYSRKQLPWQIAEELAEELCIDSPEMYQVFIDDGMTIFIKKNDKVSEHFVQAEQRVVFKTQGL